RETAQPVHPAPAPPTRMFPMRALVLVVLCALGATVAAAQDTAIVIQPESAGIMVPPPELPHAVGEDAVRRYNAPTTTRLVGRARLPQCAAARTAPRRGRGRGAPVQRAHDDAAGGSRAPAARERVARRRRRAERHGGGRGPRGRH